MATVREHLRRLARDDESGQAMVEFVIVFPVQLFFTLMILQFAFVAHAHVVVSQAAFMGARAAAAWDGVEGNPNAKDAGKREAVRTLAVLTSGQDTDLPDPTIPGDGDLRWTAEGATEYGFNEKRQKEAYALAKVTVDEDKDGYVSCEVELDYRMQIPVANHAFHAMSKEGPAGPRGYTTFLVHRVGFVATPWTKKPTTE